MSAPALTPQISISGGSGGGDHPLVYANNEVTIGATGVLVSIAHGLSFAPSIIQCVPSSYNSGAITHWGYSASADATYIYITPFYAGSTISDVQVLAFK
jgi:hypothetical protein